MQIIGIDPDIDKPGVCALDEGGNILSLESIPISTLIYDLCFSKATGEKKEVVFAIEDVSKKKATFYKKGVANHAANTRVSNSIGMVQGAHRIIKGIIEHCGYSVIDVPAGVGKQVKNNKKLFNQLSGWGGNSNEDKRDAWAIAKWAQNQQKAKK